MGILEFHLHEPEFSIGSRGRGGSTAGALEEEAAGMTMADDEDDEGGSMGAIVALALLVVAAIAIRRFRAGGDRGRYGGEREEMAEIGK